MCPAQFPLALVVPHCPPPLGPGHVPLDHRLFTESPLKVPCPSPPAQPDNRDATSPMLFNRVEKALQVTLDVKGMATSHPADLLPELLPGEVGGIDTWPSSWHSLPPGKAGIMWNASVGRSPVIAPCPHFHIIAYIV